MASSMLRWTARAIVGTAFVIGIAIGALPLWLTTPHGHRTVERALTHLLRKHVAGSVFVSRLSGSLLSGLRAEDVQVRNPRGELIGRADWISANWHPVALLWRREIDQLAAFRPVLMVERGTWKSRRGRRGAETTIWRIVATDGRLKWKKATLDKMTGTATLHSSSTLHVRALSARLGTTHLAAYGSVGWGDAQPTRVAARYSVRARDQLRGTGEVVYTPGWLEGQVAPLTISAPLAAKIFGGRESIDIRGAFRGRPRQVGVLADARRGKWRLRLRGLVEEHGRRFSVTGKLVGAPSPISIEARAERMAGILSLPIFKLRAGGSALDATARLNRRAVHALLSVRLAPTEAEWLALSTHGPLQTRVSIEGPLRDLRVRARATLERTRALVRARCDVPARRARGALVIDGLQPARIAAGAPSLVFSGSLLLDGRIVEHAAHGTFAVAHGRVTVRGRTLDAIESTGDVRLASESRLILRRLSGLFIGHRVRSPFSARGMLRWTRDRIELLDGAISSLDSHWTGSATYLRTGTNRSPLDVRVNTMVLSPLLVARLLRYRPSEPWSGRVRLAGSLKNLSLESDGITDLGPARLVARLDRAKGSTRLSIVDCHVGDSRMHGVAELERGRLTASIHELVLSPGLIHKVQPALHPNWPMHFHASADGPWSALDLRLGFDAGPSTAELRAQVALRTKRFRLVGHLDRLDLLVFTSTGTRAQGSLEFLAEGRLGNGGIIGQLMIRKARGYLVTSPFYRGLLDIRLDGRSFEVTEARVDIPGAKIAAGGGGRYGKGFRIGYGVVVTDALALRKVPRPLRLLIGINAILPGHSVEGSIRKRPGKKVEVVHRVLPIGIAQLVFLFRILTGEVPSFQNFL
jgi:hypothetical protein